MARFLALASLFALAATTAVTAAPVDNTADVTADPNYVNCPVMMSLLRAGKVKDPENAYASELVDGLLEMFNLKREVGETLAGVVAKRVGEPFSMSLLWTPEVGIEHRASIMRANGEREIDIDRINYLVDVADQGGYIDGYGMKQLRKAAFELGVEQKKAAGEPIDQDENSEYFDSQFFEAHKNLPCFSNIMDMIQNEFEGAKEDLRRAVAANAEAAFLLAVFGDNCRVDTEVIRDLFVKQELPKGFERRATEVSETDIAAALVRVISGTKCPSA